MEVQECCTVFARLPSAVLGSCKIWLVLVLGFLITKHLLIYWSSATSAA